MQTTITINEEILQKAQEALMLTHFNNVEDFIAFLVEKKLKGKKGGTALFMQDKNAEIEKECAI